MRLITILLLVLTTVPLAAQEFPRNEVAVAAGRTDFNGSTTAAAYGASYSRFWTSAISSRIGFFTAKRGFPDERGERRFRAIHADLNLHPRRGRLVSPRIGLGVAKVRYEVEPYESEGDSGTELMGTAGIDFNIRPRFAFGLDASYIPFTPNPRDRFATNLNPFTIFAMARLRW